MLTWICEHCLEPIADGTGYIAIDPAAASEHVDAVALVTPRETDDGRRAGKVVLDISDLDAFEDPIPWEVLHAACDPVCDRGDYWIAVAELRTAVDALSWTANLIEEAWFGCTEWSDLLYEIIHQLDE